MLAGVKSVRVVAVRYNLYDYHNSNGYHSVAKPLYYFVVVVFHAVNIITNISQGSIECDA